MAKQGMFFGMKKALASSFAASDGGANIIIQVLGSEAGEIINLLTDMTTHYKDEKIAIENRATLFKMAIKIKFMFDNGNIKVGKDTLHMVDPINSLCRNLLNSFEDRVVYDDKPIAQKNLSTLYRADGLSANLSRVGAALVDLVSEHMTPKNIDLLTNLLSFWSNLDYLRYVLCNDTVKEQRRELCYHLSILMTPLKIEWALRDTLEAPPAPCKTTGCDLLRLPRRAEFRGSEYCTEHYLKEVRDLLRSPTLEIYFTNKVALGIFADWLAHSSHTVQAQKNAFAFIRAEEPYKEFDRSLRPQRAKLLFGKYLDVTAPTPFLPDEFTSIVREIEEGIDTPCPSRELFDKAVSIATNILSEPFKNYLKSSHYRAFTSAIVPKDAALRAAKLAAPEVYGINYFGDDEEKKE